jgi:hypothetical protein
MHHQSQLQIGHLQILPPTLQTDPPGKSKRYGKNNWKIAIFQGVKFLEYSEYFWPKYLGTLEYYWKVQYSSVFSRFGTFPPGPFQEFWSIPGAIFMLLFQD